MAQHGALKDGDGRGWRPAPRLVLILAALACGCQAPPASYPGADPRDVELPRPVLLVRQLAADSALEGVGHPLRTGAVAVAETADTLAGAGQGLVCKRLLLPLLPAPAPLDPGRPSLNLAALEADLRKATGRGPEPADLAFSADGAEALRSLLAFIDGAARRIDLLMFLWNNDPVGWAVAEHLAARAASGLPVRVLVDGGNAVYPGPHPPAGGQANEPVAWLARQPNVCLYRTRDGWARFDHRKLVVVDGVAAWTGGRNFREEAFAHQHDISFILTGPLAADLAGEFERFWEEQGGKPAAAVPGTVREAPDCAPPTNLARLVGTGPLRHDLADAIFLAIDHARHHVYLENPYLCDSRLLLRLVKARRRGVDVRVVLTLDTTPAIASHANRVTANYLLRGGVRVYLYKGTTHVKAMSVDGLWAYVGTGNFDPLSLRHDYELGVAISAGPAIRQIEEEFLAPDFRPEWELKEPLPVTVHDCLSEVVACLFG